MKRFLLFFAAVWLSGMAFAASITLGVQKPADWGAMYIHYWNTNKGSTAWPGTQLTPDSLGWCYFTFDNDSIVNYIWNNGSGIQTGDLVARASVCQYLMPPQPLISSGHWEAIATDCGSIPPVTPDTILPPVTPQDSVVLKNITVRLSASSVADAAWQHVYLYAWSTGELLGGWPGKALEADNGWYEYTFVDYPLESVNIIWNDAPGIHAQTQNINNVGESSCFALGGSLGYGEPNVYFDCSAIDCSATDPIIPEPVDTMQGPAITVRLFPSSIVEGWNGVYLYAWTGDSTKVLGNWPGAAVSKSNGWYTYTFPANIQDVNIVWSNGAMNNANQTEDILNVTASTCYRLGYRTTMIDDYAINGIHYETTVLDCETETMMKTLYEVNQASDGTPIAVRPLTVTLAKKPYFYVQDAAGTAGLIYDTRNEWTDLAFNDIITGFEGNVKIFNGLKEMIPSISYVDWEVRNKQAGEEIVIPVATVAPTAADINKVFRYENVSFGNASYTTQKKNITVTMANGATFVARNQWGEAYTFDANKTYNFTGCVSVYNNDLQVNVTNFSEYTGSVTPVDPDTIVPQPGEAITVKLLASSVREIYNCNNVNLYAWQTEADGSYIGTPLGGWPGTRVELDSTTGWYQYTFAPEVQDVNIIWSRGCDGGNMQTQDIMHLTSSSCFRLMRDSLGVIAVGADCNIVEPILPENPDTIPGPVPNVGFTLKLSAMTVPASWEEVRLFSWTNGVDSALSTGYGLVLQADSGWYKYTFPADLEMVDLLFDNGAWGAGNQTVDLRMFADACVGFGEADETTDYKFPLLEADCITGEVAPMPVDSSAHVVYIWDNISRMYWDSIVVPYGGDVTLPTELPEYEGYHFVFWEGLYDGSNVLHNVTRDMYMQAKYYIDLPEQPVISAIPVRLKASSVPQNWEHVYIYSWTPGAMDSISWPGVEMQMTDNGWFTYRFPAGVQEIDFLFNNGDGNVGNQTVDVDNVNGEYCFEIADPITFNGYYRVFPTECSEIPEPQGMTIRLMMEEWHGGWGGSNYIYAWQHVDSVDVPLLGEWPGAEMNLNNEYWFTYTFDEVYDNVNIVFSSGGVQTVDIMGVTGSSCFQIGNGLGWRDGMYVHDVKQVDCSISPLSYHMVYFYSMDGHILDAQYVVDGDSAIAPDAPLIPGYEFVGWDADYSHITSNMSIYPIYRSITPADAFTVSLMPTNGYGWEDIYLYAWTTDSLGDVVSQPLGGWPGTKIEKDSLSGWHSYTFQYDSEVNIIWNDGIVGEGLTHQTQDILGVSESTCYRLFSRDTLFRLLAEPIDCETNLADYRTVAFISVGVVQMINQQPVGSHISVSPTIPYREGYTFAYWADMNQVLADDITVNEDIIIYAWWSRNSYMVYILDGLTGDLIISGEVLYGNSVTNLNDFIPEHEGYEFTGWTNDLSFIEDVTFTIAQFRPTYTGNASVVYTGKDGEFLDTHRIQMDLPVPPVYDGYTFIGWEVVGGAFEYGEIQIQAVYQENGGTGAPEVEGDQRGAKKILRDSKVFILTTDGKVFGSDGKLVNVEK